MTYNVFGGTLNLALSTMEASSPLVNCLSVLLGTWWQHTLAAEAMVACLRVSQASKYSSGLNSVQPTAAEFQLTSEVHVYW